jgi:hypothetical protein
LSVAPIGSWQPRRPDPEMMKRQRINPHYLPKMLQLAPPTAIHCHERWKGGQFRHCYDVLGSMLAKGMLDVESYYNIIPYERFGDLEDAFKNYHEKQFRVGVHF